MIVVSVRHILLFHCLQSNFEKKGLTDKYIGLVRILIRLKDSKKATAIPFKAK